MSLFRSRFELSFEFPPLVNPPLVKHFDLIPDFSNLPAIPTNLIFPRRDEMNFVRRCSLCRTNGMAQELIWMRILWKFIYTDKWFLWRSVQNFCQINVSLITNMYIWYVFRAARVPEILLVMNAPRCVTWLSIDLSNGRKNGNYLNFHQYMQTFR